MSMVRPGVPMMAGVGQQPPVPPPPPPMMQSSPPDDAGPDDTGTAGDVLGQVMSGFRSLSPAEQQELDAAITPRIASLFIKIVPALAPLFRYLTQNDQSTPQRPSMSGQPGY